MNIVPKFIHYTSSLKVVASNKNVIYESNNSGDSWEEIVRIPLPIHVVLILQISLLQRLFRKRVHHIVAVDNGLVIFAFGNIYKYTYDSNQLILVKKTRSKRPLCITVVNNETYYGDYISNPDRDPINVWKSTNNGEAWEIIFTFSNIRHVHGIFYDRYENCMWITTGDYGEEAALWKADLAFNKVEKIISGSQQTRAVQLLISKKFIYFGSDSPLEQNYLYRLNKRNFEIENLVEVEGSIFYGVKIGKHLFFSTVVEESEVNKSQEVVIWCSVDGLNWRRFKVFRKDRFHDTIFQYGQILFPYNDGNREFLFFTPFSTTEKIVYQRYQVND